MITTNSCFRVHLSPLLEHRKSFQIAVTKWEPTAPSSVNLWSAVHLL